MFIFVYSDFARFFRTYFAHVILLSSDFCFSSLYLYPAVLSEHKKAFPAAQRERFWFVFCFIFFFMAIPHNSKCRYGERGVADAKPKAQIILDAAKVSAASGGNSEPKQGQRSQSARGFCPQSTMRVPQPDIIEHFGNADAVPQLPERCLSRKAGIVRCCHRHYSTPDPACHPLAAGALRGSAMLAQNTNTARHTAAVAVVLAKSRSLSITASG